MSEKRWENWLIRYVWIIVAAFAVTAQAADLVVNIADMDNDSSTKTVTFPDWDTDYTKVEVRWENFDPMELWGTNGDEYDRTACLWIWDENGNKVEIIRHMTPYWNEPFVWQHDITELQALFHGEKKVQATIGANCTGGHIFSVDLEFTFGTPALLPVNSMNIWTGSTSVANHPSFFSPVSLPVNILTDQVLFRNTVTGHGNAEFDDGQTRTVTVNGGGNWSELLDRTCNTNPCSPQCGSNPVDNTSLCGLPDLDTCSLPTVCCGNWSGRRGGGWCPGTMVSPWLIDVTGQVTPGSDAIVDYDHAGVTDGTLYVETQWIEQRQTNSTVVAPDSDWFLKAMTTDAASFVGSTRSYWIKNYNAASINWTASTSENWLTVAPTGGTLAAGSAVEVTVTLNAPVGSLLGGLHVATVSIADTTNSVTETHNVELTLEDPELITHWALDETSEATAFDSSAFDRDGTVTGGPVWTPGKIGGAIHLDGIDDQVTYSFPEVQNQFAFTVSVWAKADAVGQIEWTGVFNNNSSGSDFQIDVDGNNPGNYRYAGSQTADLGPVTTDWVHLAATSDGVTTKLYYNGTALLPELVIHDNVFGQIAIGVNRASTRFFDGLIDDLRVYNYALTKEQIAQAYYDITGKAPCINTEFDGSDYDFDGSCIVDLADFAEMAAAWLDCELHPTTCMTLDDLRLFVQAWLNNGLYQSL